MWPSQKPPIPLSARLGASGMTLTVYQFEFFYHLLEIKERPSPVTIRITSIHYTTDSSIVDRKDTDRN